MYVLRTMLFVPGNDMRKIHKAGTLVSDAIILDLEDAVPLEEKETARIFIRDSLNLVGVSGAMVFVRVNALTTGLLEADLEFVVQEHLHGIMLPKSESPKDILELDQSLDRLELQRNLEKGSLRIIPLIETAKGLLNAPEIASASTRVIALAFGAVDYTREMGISLSPEGMELLYPRSRIAIVARAAEILAIDTPYTDVLNAEGLVQDTKMAQQLGFKGKLLIHPNQVERVNQVFSPTVEELEYAQRVVREFNQAKEKGIGAISLDGKMIDIANYRQAENLLTFHKLIDARDKGML